MNVLSHDLENDPDVVGLIAASAALTLSGIPFFGPVGAARVGYIDGAYVLNPTISECEGASWTSMLAGTTEGVLMVESEASELSEEIMLGAVTFGHAGFQPVIQAIIELAEVAAKEPWALPEESEETKILTARVDALARDALREAYTQTVKQVRQEKISAAKKAAARQADRGRAERRSGERPVQGAGSRHRPQQHPRYRPAHRWPRHQDRSPDPGGSRRAAAHPWLFALHPWRNPGAGRCHAGHRAG